MKPLANFTCAKQKSCNYVKFIINLKALFKTFYTFIRLHAERASNHVTHWLAVTFPNLTKHNNALSTNCTLILHDVINKSRIFGYQQRPHACKLARYVYIYICTPKVCGNRGFKCSRRVVFGPRVHVLLAVIEHSPDLENSVGSCLCGICVYMLIWWAGPGYIRRRRWPESAPD